MDSTDMPNSSTSVRLDNETKQRMYRLASARRCSAQSLLQKAVQEYVAREEVRDQLRQDAQTAWTHFEATGLHLTAEEADAWMAKLEAGEDASLPPCHA